jgi:hypothetical protein
MRRFIHSGSARRCFTALCFFWCWSFAHAQILDRIDVVPHDKEADIIIRFGTNILYQRHVPLNEGSLVRVFLRLVGPDVSESEVMQETLRSPKNPRLPTVTVIYPELVNGMLVTFSQSTRYSVRPGANGRSIVITVPFLPEQSPGPAAAKPGPRFVAEPKAIPALELALQAPAPVPPKPQSEELKVGAGKTAAPAAATPPPQQAPRIVTAEPKVVPALELALQEPPPKLTPAPGTTEAKTAESAVVAEKTPPPALAAALPERPRRVITAEPKVVPALEPALQEPAPKLAPEPKPVPVQIAAAPTAKLPNEPKSGEPVPANTAAPAVVAEALPPAPPVILASLPVQTPAKTVVGPPAQAAAVPTASTPVPLPLPAAVVAVTPGPAAAAAPLAAEAPAAPVMSQAEVETRAGGFIEEARRAIVDKDLAKAINRLNRILGMPQSGQTEAALALIGEARELNGEFLKAKAEYELYLKLYPTGLAADRVKQRLAALPHDTVARAATRRPLPKEAGPAEWTYFGSLSSYYYTGKSQIDTLTPPPPGELTFNRTTLSMVDQKSLISSINLNARRRDAFSDTRIVYRETINDNYLRKDRSYDRLYSAYIDHNDRKEGYYVRAGRQNPNGMGVMERFDGFQAGYNLNPDWRVNAVYGDAVEFNSPFKKNFYGASVDLIPQTGAPGLSVYGIQQTLDGYLNRRALGTELRYFDGHVTGYGMVDYDLLYKGLNIALLQGNYLAEGGTNYFMVLDHRRAPSYALTNAMPGSPGLTLKEMITFQDLATVRQQASDLSAMSDMFSVGVTHPLTERWQVGVDYRLSQISETKPVNAVIPLAVIGTCLGTVDVSNDTCVFTTATQPASGKSHVVTFQAIGNSLFFPNAVGVGNLSLIQAPTYTGQSTSLSYVFPYTDQWRFDLNLRYYTQKDSTGGTQNRTSPSFKASWQWQNSLYLEGEIGRETSKSESETSQDRTDREYMYMGLRWDFR